MEKGYISSGTVCDESKSDETRHFSVTDTHRVVVS